MKKTNSQVAIIGLAIIIGLHLFLLSKLIFFPYPEMFIYSYLTKAGLLPYKQIMDQHFPGLLFLPINFATLGMVTPQIARFWHFGVVAFTQILLFLIAKKMFRSGRFALLANFLYLVWQPYFEGYVLWIDSFIPLMLLPAFYFLLEFKRKSGSRQLFLAGLFLGLALIFKQVVLPLIALILVLKLLDTKEFIKTLPLIFGVATPIAVMVFYIIRIGVWNDFIYWTVTFNLTTFAQMGRKYPGLFELIKTVPIFGFAIMALVFSFFGINKSKLLNKDHPYQAVLSLFFLGSLIFAYARFDYIHLQPALPFAILLLVYLAIKIPKRYLLPIITVYLMASSYFLIPFYKMHVGDRILFFGEFERQVSKKVLQYVDPGKSVFAMGTTPHLYQMTATLPPGRVFVFQFPWFMVKAENRILSGIISDPPVVIVRDKTAATGGKNLVSFMPNINKFVNDNYKVVEMLDNAEIMIRK